MPELGAVTQALPAIARDNSADRVVASRICQACVAGLDIDGAATLAVDHEPGPADPRGDRSDGGAAGGPAVHPERGCLQGGRDDRPSGSVLVADIQEGVEVARWPVFA